MGLGRVFSSTLVSALASYALLSAGACSTNAVGVEECRRIETARCAAAGACGIIDDLEECERYYRDHCLHGLSLEEEPGDPLVDACVAAIERIASCAESEGDVAAMECPEGAPATTRENTPEVSICQWVLEPQNTAECGFLTPPPDAPPEDPDAAGAAGADGG